MKNQVKLTLGALFAALVSLPSRAADPACAPIIKAGEAHAKAERMRVRMLLNDANRPSEIEAMIVPEACTSRREINGSGRRSLQPAGS